MNHKWSLLGKCSFYRLEEAIELPTNMSDSEGESTSESENEGDSSDSAEDAPEQHQVRTISNILMPKETKVSNAKEIPKKGQKAVPKLGDNQSATKAMASKSSDMDVDDYYVIEDANESASAKYVPCINYAYDKVYLEDVKNGWVRLEQDTGPPKIYRFEGSSCNYLNLNNYTPGAVLMSFLMVKCGHY